ncbi:hypothetical protein HaLaN_16568, partial [Haematococcus lacustris]
MQRRQVIIGPGWRRAPGLQEDRPSHCASRDG